MSCVTGVIVVHLIDELWKRTCPVSSVHLLSALQDCNIGCAWNAKKEGALCRYGGGAAALWLLQGAPHSCLPQVKAQACGISRCLTGSGNRHPSGGSASTFLCVHQQRGFHQVDQ